MSWRWGRGRVVVGVGDRVWFLSVALQGLGLWGARTLSALTMRTLHCSPSDMASICLLTSRYMIFRDEELLGVLQN